MSGPSVPTRRLNGTFAPGHSGNPTGRPAVVAEITELARAHTADAIATLVAICRNGASESARVAAANALLDRGYGRPPQAIEHQVQPSAVVRVPVVCATTEEWLERVRPKAETVQ